MRRFIHVPKTGGTSVVNYMLQHGIECLWGGKLPPQGWLPVKKHAPVSLWHLEPSEKFAVIRHPATRLVSAFRYSQVTFQEFQNCTFADFVRSRLDHERSRVISPWREQCYWLMHQDRVIVDRLLRMENLEHDVHEYLGNFGPLSRLNTTSEPHEDLMDWYTEKDMRRVKKAFARDFEILGYQ